MSRVKATDIETLRIRMGLSGPQMLKAIGAKPSHRSLLRGAFQVDPLFARQADELYHDFLTYRAEVDREVAAEFGRRLDQERELVAEQRQHLRDQGQDAEADNLIEPVLDDIEITTYEVSRILHMSQWNLLQLIVRGVFVPSRSTGRQHKFTVASIDALWHTNSQCLVDIADGRRRGPLATTFLNWRRRTGRDQSIRFKPFTARERELRDPLQLSA